MSDAINDTVRRVTTGLELDRARERANYASAAVDVARMRHAAALLVSQHEPVASLGMDRDQLRVLLRYVDHGDETRMWRELAALKEGRGDE